MEMQKLNSEYRMKVDKIRKWAESLDDDTYEKFYNFMDKIHIKHPLNLEMMVSQIDKGEVDNIYYNVNGNIFNVMWKPIDEL